MVLAYAVGDQERLLVDQHDKLAHKLALKYSRKYKDKYDYDDLYQAARLGIIDAARSFDPTRNVKFITHAYNRAVFSVLRLIRSDSGVVHIPYKVARGQSTVEPPQRVHLVPSIEAGLMTGDEIGSSEVKLIIEEAMCCLTPRQHQVVSLLIMQQHTAEEVGAIIGITPENVYATARKSVEKLRKLFNEQGIELGDIVDM